MAVGKDRHLTLALRIRMLSFLKKTAFVILIGLSIVLFSRCAILSFSGGPTVQQVYEDLKGSVAFVAINTDSKSAGYGTAFAVIADNGTKYLITNAHVCEHSTSSRVKVVYGYGSSKIELAADIAAISDNYDLCAVILKPNPLVALPVGETISINEHVYTAGYPNIEFLSTHDGYIIGLSPYQIATDISVHECVGEKYDTYIKGDMAVCVMSGNAIITTVLSGQGASGSPLLNEDMEVIGVVNYIYGDNAYAGAVPLEDLLDFLSEL